METVAWETGLLHFALQNGITLNDADLAQSLATNFFGGVFSCSSTIISALYLLAGHAGEHTRLADAVRDDSDLDSDYSKLMACSELDQAMRETMRYYPAVPIYFRNVSKTKEVQLGGHTLPANTLIFISNWWLHKLSEFWGDPETFRPERWTDQFTADNPIGSGHFFPFGRGPRMCIGSSFARLLY